MKRNILFILNLVTGIILCCAQSGTWSGNLEVQGMKIPLVFHLDDENPTVDSPAQGVKGIPAQVTRTPSGDLTVNIPVIGASYVGKVTGDEISGTFTQHNIKFPLVLVKGEKSFHRPQTPVPPFPYTQEDISFANGDAILKGTLTLPDGYDKDTPVVIMITGSGLQNRDEEFQYHKPFAVIADALARNRIASLRYDDRGFGESTGDVINCTTEDLMNDALAGINLLRHQFNKVGVLGHSEGGTIAFMLGANNNADFIVSLAGMVVSGKELLLDQNRHVLNQASYPKHVIDEYCNLLESAFDRDDLLSEKLNSSNLPEELKQNLQIGLVQLNTPYMQYFLTLDVRDRLNTITCPVLALNGTKDTQVSCVDNLEALNSNLPTNIFRKVMKMEGLNHLFQHCETGSTIEYATIEETISPEVLELICQWIKSLSSGTNKEVK